jgi:multidrug resistance protein
VTTILSATGFNRIVVSTIMAPALPAMAAELAMSPTQAALSLSIYLLATAFGPLVMGPLSEMYGRQVVLHASNVWFVAFNLLCGFATSKEVLIAARLFTGLGASAIYSLGGGVLGDVWSAEQRGKSLGTYLAIPLVAVAVGPIIGGVITARADWRWMFWATSVFQGVSIVVCCFTFHETSAEVILRRRAARLRRTTGDKQVS